MNTLSAWFISVGLFLCGAEGGSAETLKLTVASEIFIESQSLCVNNEEGKLRINSSCLVIVRASDSANSVGITVDEGEEYTVTVPRLELSLSDSRIALPSEQVWHDSSIPNVPPCGTPGTFLMNMFAPLKKSKNSLWFSLIAEIEGGNAPHDFCEDESIKVTRPGKLIMYANDAHGFYGNNSGKILVKIQRNEDYR